MKTSLNELMAKIPGAPNEKWPDGDRYAVGFEHGTMTLGFYAPVGADPQFPHDRDEIYIIHTGTTEFVLDGEISHLTSGDAIFVPAGAVHRFENLATIFQPGSCFGDRAAVNPIKAK